MHAEPAHFHESNLWSTPIRDLGLTLEGTRLEPILAEFEGEQTLSDDDLRKTAVVLSGALYPTVGMPAPLRLLARLNPVTYQVDLMRHAFGQAAEFALGLNLVALLGVTAAAFGLTALLFDPEQRFVGRGGRGSVSA